ncbi:unnamed protein product [marine sediment metagenome]|uniref:Uncharacterized protein n=1 Tax=marine sediment metagenome TaxID=412755 RepID=X1RBE8_9ZZZZ
MTNLSVRTEFFDIYLPPTVVAHLGPMRNLIEAGNDKIGGALRMTQDADSSENAIACLISGIPREVPDWVVSGLAGMR